MSVSDAVVTMNFGAPCVFGFGAVAQLPKVLAGLGVTRPMLITDPGIRAAGLLEVVEAAMARCPAVAVFDQTQANPTERQAREAVAMWREAAADGVVALGGGSALDMGKAVALLSSHDAPLETYAATRGGARRIGRVPPVVAIPTTAGTGSEVSVGFILIQEDGRKETYVSPNLIPATAICDPGLTMGLPPHLTAATGMDAVTHCIEAILVPRSNPLAEAVGYDGLVHAVGEGWLKRAVADPSDREARWNMMLASHEGAMAFVKGLGGVHALSHAAGRLHEKRLHHGTLNALFLPHLMRFNAGAAPEKEARLRTVMGHAPGADLAEALAELNAALGLPSRLSALGLSMDDGPGIVDFALTDLAHATNVRSLARSDYEAIYAAAL
jgi:alcohol dehydrogenase class IV